MVQSEILVECPKVLVGNATTPEVSSGHGHLPTLHLHGRVLLLLPLCFLSLLLVHGIIVLVCSSTVSARKQRRGFA